MIGITVSLIALAYVHTQMHMSDREDHKTELAQMVKTHETQIELIRKESKHELEEIKGLIREIYLIEELEHDRLSKK